MLIRLTSRKAVNRSEIILPDPLTVLVIACHNGCYGIGCGYLPLHNPVVAEVAIYFILFKVSTDIVPEPVVFKPFLRQILNLRRPHLILDVCCVIFFEVKILICDPVEVIMILIHPAMVVRPIYTRNASRYKLRIYIRCSEALFREIMNAS